MHCEQAEMLLSEMAFGSVDLDEQVMRELTEHLDGCTTCREQLGDMRVVTKLINEGIHTEEAPVLSGDRIAALLALDNQDDDTQDVGATPISSAQGIEAKDSSRRTMRFQRYQKPLAVAASLGLLATGSFVLLTPVQQDAPRGNYAYITVPGTDEAKQSSDAIGSENLNPSDSGAFRYSPPRRGDVNLKYEAEGRSIADELATASEQTPVPHTFTAPSEAGSEARVPSDGFRVTLDVEPAGTREKLDERVGLDDKRDSDKDRVVMNKPREVERYYLEPLGNTRNKNSNVTAPSTLPAPLTSEGSQNTARDLESTVSELSNGLAVGSKLRGVSTTPENREADAVERGLWFDQSKAKPDDVAVVDVAGAMVTWDELKNIAPGFGDQLSTGLQEVGGGLASGPTTRLLSDSGSSGMTAQSAQAMTESKGTVEDLSKLRSESISQTVEESEEAYRQKASDYSFGTDNASGGQGSIDALGLIITKEVAGKAAQHTPEPPTPQADPDGYDNSLKLLSAVASQPTSGGDRDVTTFEKADAELQLEKRFGAQPSSGLSEWDSRSSGLPSVTTAPTATSGLSLADASGLQPARIKAKRLSDIADQQPMNVQDKEGTIFAGLAGRLDVKKTEETLIDGTQLRLGESSPNLSLAMDPVEMKSRELAENEMERVEATQTRFESAPISLPKLTGLDFIDEPDLKEVAEIAGESLGRRMISPKRIRQEAFDDYGVAGKDLDVNEDLNGDEITLPLSSQYPVLPVNPFVLTSQDHLSTFAMDVDTAAYTLARRFIRNGYRPPVGSVRMEEFINAFDYNYATQSNRTFTVHTTAAPSPYGQNLTLVKIGVKARVVGRDGRKPAHLTLVVDASGSMDKNDRLPLVKHSLKLMVDQLQADDSVSLITYGTHSRLLLQSVSASNKQQINETIDAIQTGGSTNMIEALNLGYEQARAFYKAGYINRVMLCSDGVANIGDTDAQTMLTRVDDHRRHGITFTSVGFGLGAYNDALLEKLANRGDGFYAYVDSKVEAKRLFVTQLSATLQTVAKDAKIQVDFNPLRVRRYRLVGYENRDVADKDFRNDAVDAGEVGSGQSSTALYEVELIDQADGPNPHDLGAVYVRYRDVDTEKVEEISQRLNHDMVQHVGIEQDPYFHLAAGVGEFAEQLRSSEHASPQDMDRLQRTLIQLRKQLPLNDQVRELQQLIEQVQGLPKAP